MAFDFNVCVGKARSGNHGADDTPEVKKAIEECEKQDDIITKAEDAEEAKEECRNSKIELEIFRERAKKIGSPGEALEVLTQAVVEKITGNVSPSDSPKEYYTNAEFARLTRLKANVEADCPVKEEDKGK